MTGGVSHGAAAATTAHRPLRDPARRQSERQRPDAHPGYRGTPTGDTARPAWVGGDREVAVSCGAWWRIEPGCCLRCALVGRRCAGRRRATGGSSRRRACAWCPASPSGDASGAVAWPGADGPESAHRPQSVLRRDVGPLDRLRLRPARPVPPALRVYRPGHGIADGADGVRVLVGADSLGCGPTSADREDEARPRAGQIAVRAQQHIRHLPSLVDRPVQGGPLPAGPHIRRVAPPARAGARGRLAARPRQQRRGLLDPIQDCPGGDVDAALGQQVAHGGGGVPLAPVPAHGGDDDLLRPAVSGERGTRTYGEGAPAGSAAILPRLVGSPVLLHSDTRTARTRRQARPPAHHPTLSTARVAHPDFAVSPANDA